MHEEKKIELTQLAKQARPPGKESDAESEEEKLQRLHLQGAIKGLAKDLFNKIDVDTPPDGIKKVSAKEIMALLEKFDTSGINTMSHVQDLIG